MGIEKYGESINSGERYRSIKKKKEWGKRGEENVLVVGGKRNRSICTCKMGERILVVREVVGGYFCGFETSDITSLFYKQGACSRNKRKTRHCK